MKQRRSSRKKTDDFYAACLSMRAMPLLAFLADNPPKWPLVIVSLSESKLLNELALPKAEQKLICGLQLGPSPSSVVVRGGTILSETQLANLATVRLARDPPPRVGQMQRRAAGILLRVYPHGFRFSGKNMTPLPCWLSGAHYAAVYRRDSNSHAPSTALAAASAPPAAASAPPADLHEFASHRCS